MARYGRALMDALPLGSILVTSYDMQWTAARYLHVCEGYRCVGCRDSPCLV